MPRVASANSPTTSSPATSPAQPSAPSSHSPAAARPPSSAPTSGLVAIAQRPAAASTPVTRTGSTVSQDTASSRPRTPISRSC